MPKDKGEELQQRVVRSHSACVGSPLKEDEVRAAMLLRANTLAKGYSAVRLDVVDMLIKMLNRGVCPVVYEKGSLGASGDLAPLAHIALVMMGEGMALYHGEEMSGADALKRAGLKPIALSFKEGLALINGSQVFTAVGLLCLHDALLAVKNAQVITALTLTALDAIADAFDERVHRLRPYLGQMNVAANLRALMGEKLRMQKSTGEKVQDAYSLRCYPQIVGPTVDALEYAKKQVEIEINSALDNPLFFPENGDYVSCGNFHGQSIALVLDYLSIALSEVANVSERHINRLLNSKLSGLPPFLTKEEGLNSGLMMAQYTAASLVSENKVLSHPASVDSIPVSADQEDHVSMGPIAARKLREIVRNVNYVLAIELMCAAQALEFCDRERLSRGVSAAYETVRRIVPPLKEDRVLHDDIVKLYNMLGEGTLLENVEAVVGPLR